MLLLTAAGNLYACSLKHGEIQPTLTMPTRYKDNNFRYAYSLRLLQLALDKTQDDFGPCKLIPLANNRPINRTLMKIHDGESFDIVDSTVSPQRDESLRAIPFPIYRGLMGIRVMVIREGEQRRFDDIKHIEDLRTFTYGISHNWNDRNILQKNSFKTVTGDGLSSLYRMLPAGRFDVLLRGSHEIILDLLRADPVHVDIEKGLIIAFPLPVNYYVAKHRRKLAERILEGLERAFADGSMLTLFNNNELIKKTLIQLNLEERKFYYLCNPTLTRSSKLNKNNYWHKPWPKEVLDCQSKYLKATTL